MKPGSLPALSRRAAALLSVERDIVPQLDQVRRRAQLRARTALWQTRAGREVSGLMLFWRRFRLVAAGAVLATSGFAAWLNLAPESAHERPAVNPPTVIEAPPAQRTGARPPTAQTAAEFAAEPEATSSAPEGAAATTPATMKPRVQAESAGRQKRDTQVEELTLLDRARRAVVSGDNKGALALVDRHRRLFPKSQLGEEREALRVRALKGAGLSKQAGRAASEFESRYPNSVLAPQMNDDKRSPR